MIKHVFLDFDGTIMVYDEEPGYFHPKVIEKLNTFPACGITWYTNSGRTREGQRQVLELSRKHGLTCMPEALICGESYIYLRAGDEYVEQKIWNTEAKNIQTAFHAGVQRILRPRLAEFARYVPADKTFLTDMGTYFYIDDLHPDYQTVAGMLRDVILQAGGGLLVKNGPWLFAQPNELNKGRALREFMEKNDLPSHQVLAVGDHENDLSMLDGTSAGKTGCPASAIPEVRLLVSSGNGYVSPLEGPLGTLDVLCHYLDP